VISVSCLVHSEPDADKKETIAENYAVMLPLIYV